jgi:hypothetical protein
VTDPRREALIAAFEAKLGCLLPPDYRAWLAAGPVPRRSEDEIEDDTPADDRGTYLRLLDRLYDLGGDPEHDLDWAYGAYRDQLPAGLIPVTHDPFGNPFCLGTIGEATGRVYYIPVDGGPGERRVAESFTEFLAMLRARAGGDRPA